MAACWVLLGFLQLGCTEVEQIVPVPDGWRKVAVENIVSFAVPPDMVEEEGQPIDSIFGFITSDSCKLTYDYGRFSADLTSYAEYPAFRKEKVRIGGKKAMVVQFVDHESDPAFPYIVAIQFSKAVRGNRLTLYASCAHDKDREQARMIFETLRF